MRLSAEDLARAAGVDDGARSARLAELDALDDRLARVMEPDHVAAWLRSPVPLLDDDVPLDVIAAGEHKRVSRVVASLESPGAA